MRTADFAWLLFLHCIPVVLAGEGSPEFAASFAARAPTIDGFLEEEEWGDAARSDVSFLGWVDGRLVEGHEAALYLKHDGKFLYLAVKSGFGDPCQDIYSEEDCPDSSARCTVYLDGDHDHRMEGAPSDIAFTQTGPRLGGNSFAYVEPPVVVPLPAGASAASAFGDIDRVVGTYEYRIPLDPLQIDLRRSVGFALFLSSEEGTPYYYPWLTYGGYQKYAHLRFEVPPLVWIKEEGIRIDHGGPLDEVNAGYGSSVLETQEGKYRLYYTGYYPTGFNILSATSGDGLNWTKEDTVRVQDAQNPFVIALPGGSLRMYYTQVAPVRWRIRSAVSADGLRWTVEEGIRLAGGGEHDPLGAAFPCVLSLPDGRHRMYYAGVGPHHRILSAVSADGLDWTPEEGIRVDSGGSLDAEHATCPRVLVLPGGKLKMYYSGTTPQGDGLISRILSASSEDGMAWTKDEGIAVDAGGVLDRNHVSPSSIFRFRDVYRMFYDASSDPSGYGWRILSAVSYAGGLPTTEGCPLSFAGRSYFIDFIAGGGVQHLVRGDFNSDGIADLALGGYFDIFVLLGRTAGAIGEGAFWPPARYPVSGYPIQIVLGDFNGDGITDLASANAWHVAVLLGNGEAGAGDGTFAPPTYFPSSGSGHGWTISITAADFNGDRIEDLAVANQQSSDVSILMGNGSDGIGDGTFQAPRSYAVGSLPTCIISGDLDEDGITDLAVSIYYGIAVLIGDGAGGVGDGTFKAPIHYDPNDCCPYGIAAGDFNEDGIADLVATDLLSQRVSVFLGHRDDAGGKVFLPPVFYGAHGRPCSVVVGDLNADGISDLVASNIESDDVTVLLGNGWKGTGDGTFADPLHLPAGREPAAVICGDLDGDGAGDIASSNWGSGDVTIFYGLCRKRAVLSLEPEEERAPCVKIVLETSVEVCGGEFGLGWDADLARTVSCVPIGSLGALREGGGPEFLGISYLPEAGDCPGRKAGLTVGWLNQYESPSSNFLAPGRHELFEVCFAQGLVSHLTDPVPIEFLECLKAGPSSPPVKLALSTPGGEVVHPASFGVCVLPGALFRRCDFDGDGDFSITDAVIMLLCMFSRDRELDCDSCVDAGDCNDDELLDITDPIFYLRWKFLGGDMPGSPLFTCGFDFAGDGLSCAESQEACEGSEQRSLDR